MKNIILFVFLFFCSYLQAESISEKPLRHHIIIAIDKAGCDGWIGNAEVGRYVNYLIHSKLSSEEKSVRSYYEPGDYISVVGFRINSDQKDMSVFSMPLKSGKGTMSYMLYDENQLERMLLKEWPKIALQTYNQGKSSFSLVSVAKEYALSALKSEGQQVGRTFLVMITDRHYNGNNFYDEMKAFEEHQKHYGAEKLLTPQKIFKHCYEVQQYYFCNYISTGSIWAGNSFSPKGYVELYEYLPLQRNFTLSAAINYPTHLKAKRNRDGNYSVELPLSWSGGNHYTFNHLEAFPNYGEKVLYETPQDAIKLDELTVEVRTINVPGDKTAKSIQLRVWLGLIDGFYNATLMSPDIESPIESGRQGLNTIVPIEYEEDATILGVPIPGVLWPPFVEDQYTAVLVWKIILWILFIGWLIWMGYRLARPEYYKPRADEFTIGYKE